MNLPVNFSGTVAGERQIRAESVRVDSHDTWTRCMKNCTEGNPRVKWHKDIDPDLEKRTIIAGELCVSREPVIIKTLLGSCVSVCLYDPGARVGGMNHILLPGSADMDQFNTSARYGVNAMDKLITRMLANGVDRKKLVAKVFGGAHILEQVD